MNGSCEWMGKRGAPSRRRLARQACQPRHAAMRCAAMRRSSLLPSLLARRLRHARPQPAPTRSQPRRVARSRAACLIGLTAAELVQRFGQPALPDPRRRRHQAAVRGARLRARRLSLSAGRAARGAERVTHVDARAPLRRRHRRQAAASPRSRRAEAAPAPIRRLRRPPGRGRRDAARPSPTSAGSPLLPAAIRQLRIIRLRPMRLIGEPANISRKPASSSASRSASRGAASSARGRKARLACGGSRRSGSTGTPPGNRRSRRCGCRSPRETRAGSARDARSSDRKCSAAHRSGRARRSRRSGRRRCSAVQLPQCWPRAGASGSSSSW